MGMLKAEGLLTRMVLLMLLSSHPEKAYSHWTAAAMNLPLPRTTLILPIRE